MFFHRTQRQLFLRIAYAGAPLSGKTETLKALLPMLQTKGASETVFSPFAARGRTLYFDWAQYQGGVFLDGPLQCQITSVPGQESLHRRRRVLIEDADVVVFVIDAQPDQLETNRRCLAEIQPWLTRGDLPPISVVYQANKRDLPGTLDVADIRQQLALDAAAEVYETSALQGEGVRICFVAGVRACVRRAEALRAANRLPEGAPDVETGEQLLERVRLADTPEPLPATSDDDSPSKPQTAPSAPDTATQPEPAPTQAARDTATTPEPAPTPAAPGIAARSERAQLQAARDTATESEPAPAPAALDTATLPAPAPAPAARDIQTRPDHAARFGASTPAAAASLAPPAASPTAAAPPLALPPQAAPTAAWHTAPTPAVAEAAAGTAGARRALGAASAERPAVMPMADWQARQQVAAAPPAAEEQAPAAAPQLAAAAPAAVTAMAPRVGGRAAVMPMADWLATYINRAGAAERSTHAAERSTHAAAQAAVQAQPEADSPRTTQAAMPVLTLPPGPAAHPHLRAVQPLAALPPTGSPQQASAPAPTPSGSAVPAPPVIAAAPPVPVSDQQPAPSTPPAATPAPPPTTAAAATHPAAAAPAQPAVAAPPASGPPVPWLPGHEATLLDAWPLAIWRLAFQAAGPQPQAPSVVAGTMLQGRVGGGWHARAWGTLESPDAGRAEFKRLVSWLMRLGNSVSSRRCLVLAGSDQGCCVWQVVHQELTFDQLIDQTLEEELPAKEAVQIMAGTAVDFVNAAQEFALQGVELPIRFHTLARENGFTVYSAFLPREPLAPSGNDALVELAGELRFFLQAERLGQLDVTEALRELERLSETRPRNSPAIEVLQSLLIGE
jgi:signal recognition particle receptor subunit beta